jgi:hypothetical protein
MDQIEAYNPPPNPAKQTDTRFQAYQEKFGSESWELDALNPDTLNTLIQEQIESYIDHDKWNEQLKVEEEAKSELIAISDRYGDVQEFLKNPQ